MPLTWLHQTTKEAGLQTQLQKALRVWPSGANDMRHAPREPTGVLVACPTGTNDMQHAPGLECIENTRQAWANFNLSCTSGHLSFEKSRHLVFCFYSLCHKKIDSVGNNQLQSPWGGGAVNKLSESLILSPSNPLQQLRARPGRNRLSWCPLSGRFLSLSPNTVQSSINRWKQSWQHSWNQAPRL